MRCFLPVFATYIKQYQLFGPDLFLARTRARGHLHPIGTLRHWVAATVLRAGNDAFEFPC